MTPVAIQLMAAIETRLRAISVAGGYLTDLGATLLVGWPAHLLADQQAALPLIALHPDADEIDHAQRANQIANRDIAVELIANPHDTDTTYFDQALYDIRRALVGVEHEVVRVVTLVQGRAVWDHPDDNSVLVRMSVPITITYTDFYGG